MCVDCVPETYQEPTTRWCSGCRVDLPVDLFPLNRTGTCKACHREATRRAYRARKLVVAAGAILRAEEAVTQLWCLLCGLCGEEAFARRRATVKPFVLQVGTVRCGRCGSGVLASLVTGPATLAAAQAELRRIA